MTNNDNGNTPWGMIAALGILLTNDRPVSDAEFNRFMTGMGIWFGFILGIPILILLAIFAPEFLLAVILISAAIGTIIYILGTLDRREKQRIDAVRNDLSARNLPLDSHQQRQTQVQQQACQSALQEQARIQRDEELYVKERHQNRLELQRRVQQREQQEQQIESMYRMEREQQERMKAIWSQRSMETWEVEREEDQDRLIQKLKAARIEEEEKLARRFAEETRLFESNQ